MAVFPGVDRDQHWMAGRRRHRSTRRLVLIACLCAFMSPSVLSELDRNPAKPAFKPGKELRVNDPATGGLGYWTLYLPADYRPDKKWPVIFTFHGLGQDPSSWPFRQLTNGEGFVIVGMEYLQRGLDGINRLTEAENLKRVFAIVSDWLSMDEGARLVGGFSKGGWHASNMAERTSELWAGAIILGAGRSSTPDATGLATKPVFIGVGENDIEQASAAAAARFYEGIGASVTLVTFDGKGHTVDTEDPILRQWLLDREAARKTTEP